MEVVEFLSRYPCDARAVEYLEQADPEVAYKVITTFDPHNKNETDYSKLLTGYINSMKKENSGKGLKRSREEEEALLVEDTPELEAFRMRYPMDDRAFEFLNNTYRDARQTVLQTFRPKTEGSADYSSLITSVVKKARLDEGKDLGPELAILNNFRMTYPMDDRAWEYLYNANGSTQSRVVNEFQPRNEGEADYSAAVTTFVKRVSGGKDGGKGHFNTRHANQAKLDEFRMKFPCDDRAFDFLTSCSPEVQREALSAFNPPSTGVEADFSRQLTSFLKSLKDSGGKGGGSFGKAGDFGKGGGGGSFGKAGDFGKGGGGSGGRKGFGKAKVMSFGDLHTFRRKYPMDDRALDFLEQQSEEVQDCVLSDFKPRRENDADYSAAVTSFTRQVLARFQKNSPGFGQMPLQKITLLASSPAPKAHTSSKGFGKGSKGGAGGAQGNADAIGFRKKYPMDERAFDFLTSSEPDVQKRVIEQFKPRAEGEQDYSRPITSFVKACRGSNRW